tara:strand:+ start:745 stop:912 length:168 start_codon:yes stop_codon:yes gene_type:complete
MIFKSKINSKKFIYLASRKSGKRENLKSIRKNKKKQFNMSSQDEKLIYAFFLDIA